MTRRQRSDELRTTKSHVFRVAVALVVFALAWALLALSGHLLVDIETLRDDLSESAWLRFLAPPVRDYLVTHAWQQLGALLIAIAAYRISGGFSNLVAGRLFPAKPEFDLSSDSAEVLECLWKDNLLRREAKIAEELGISVDRVSEALRELQGHDLVRPRRRRSGLFWDKTAKGRRYLGQG